MVRSRSMDPLFNGVMWSLETEVRGHYISNFYLNLEKHLGCPHLQGC